MKNVIITGANGFIGSFLVKKLVVHNINVVAIDVSFSNNPLFDNKLITVVESNLQNTDELLSRLNGVTYDAFYHFAWQGVNGAKKADPSIQVHNINTMISCINLAKELKCKKFLCAGTIAEQSVNSLSNITKANGNMLYGISKHCAHLILETYCKNIDLDFVWMQFSNIYGPENKTGNLISYTINELMNNRKASFGPAEQPYDFILIDDLIEAVYRLGSMKTKENSYFIGSGSPRILKDYLLDIGKICNKEHLICIGERPDDGIVYTMDIFDTSELVRDIGTYTTKSFEEGIKLTLEDY